MTSRNSTSSPRDLATLFAAGTVAGLTDGQLLDRFASRGGDPAELAFEALVERHGPMVLRACRAILRDEQEAQDAFQATFLALIRRAGTLRVQDSLGPWLYRVACRASVRSRVASARRSAAEREWPGRVSVDDGPDVRDDLGPALGEEIDRLSERHRLPVVLCEPGGPQLQRRRRDSWGVPWGRSRAG